MKLLIPFLLFPLLLFPLLLFPLLAFPQSVTWTQYDIFKNASVQSSTIETIQTIRRTGGYTVSLSITCAGCSGEVNIYSSNDGVTFTKIEDLERGFSGNSNFLYSVGNARYQYVKIEITENGGSVASISNGIFGIKSEI